MMKATILLYPAKTAGHILLALFALLFCTLSQAQTQREGELIYEPDETFPFGRPNPDAPPQISQFAFMIGKNDCIEERQNNATGEWEAGTRTWDAYYYLNGNAIRDAGRSGVATNGNIRIFDPASGQWRVTYFSTPVYGSGTWVGGMVDGRIELERPQKAPGTQIDGINRLTFFDISNSAFKWKGEWVSLDGATVFNYWRISCEKVN